jgi:hypothetical protein
MAQQSRRASDDRGSRRTMVRHRGIDIAFCATTAGVGEKREAAPDRRDFGGRW